MNGIGDVLRFLDSKGFKPIPAKRPSRAFVGNLQCAQGLVSVKLSIEDWDFFEYPKITLLAWPTFFPELFPHCDIHGDLCYFAPRSVTLDRYDPVIAIGQCLDQATNLLNKIGIDSEYRSADIQLEFQAHWNYRQSKLPFTVLIGDIEPNTTVAEYFSIEESHRRLFMVSSSMQQAQQLSNALGGKLKPKRSKCWLMRTNKKPQVPEKMPITVKEVMAWLREWDQDLNARMQKVLGEAEYLKHSCITFAIHSPIGWIGFGFDLDQMKRLGYSRSPKKYRDYLHKSGGAQPLFRIALQEVGGRFVHSRNLSFPDLYNKRVILVGCGAIGSFLASALARLGAGTGKLGLLILIDPDILGPENLGRHTLGFPDLYKPKSDALCRELKKQFPFSRFESVVNDVRKYVQVFEADLLIDATGEEAVCEYLNDMRLQRHAKVPVLHAWIRGNGEAVQAFWADSEGEACYRCLLVPDSRTHRKQRFPLLKHDVVKRSDGCRAYTPYAVSVPMEAAALAADMVCDWLNGDPSPRFRTRSRENVDVFQVKNQNPKKMAGCPACDSH